MMKNKYNKILAGLAISAFVFGLSASMASAMTAPTIVSESASAITQTTATLDGTVNPNGVATTAWFEVVGMSGTFGNQNIGSGIIDVTLTSYTLSGLTPNTTYTYRVSAMNGLLANGAYRTFTTLPVVQPTAPTIVSETVSGITQTSAVLHGSVNPNGTSTDAWYEVSGMSGTFGNQNIGSGINTVAMTTYTLTGLTPSTTYSFRVSAINGPLSNGNYVTFTTLAPVQPVAPTIVSETASNITATSVTLNGSVNPNGTATTAWFEVSGIAGTFGNQNIGSGISTVVLNPYTLSGLTPSTTYWFRVSAINGPLSNGNYISFTTLPTSTPACVITSFSASPSSISSGSSSSLAWTTSNCTSASISSIGAVAVNSSITTGALSNTITYTLTATNATSSDSKQVTVTVNSTVQNCAINSFTANPSTITSGSSASLTWTTSNCTSASISSFGAVAVNSSISTGILSNTTTFTLSATGSNGTVTQSVTVTVSQAQQASCSITSFSASPAVVNYGSSATLYWNTSNCTSVSISGGSISGNLSTNSSVSTGALYGTTTYTLSAYGINTVTSQIVVTTSNNTVYGNTVTTNPATNVTTTGAILNGYVYSNSNASYTTYSFRYGTNAGLLYSSTPNAYLYGSGGTVSATLSGLVPNTTYYFQTTGVTNGTISYGQILSFVTSAQQTFTYTLNPPVSPANPAPTIIYLNSTNTSGGSSTVNDGSNLLVLTIENRYQEVRAGETIDYTIHYRNISGKTLSNAILTIGLPSGIHFDRSSEGRYDDRSATFTDTLGTLAPGAEGNVYLSGTLDSVSRTGDTIVTNANMSFTASGLSENVTAYVTNKVAGGTLGAFALGAGTFFPHSLVGWFLIVLAILAIILIARRMGRKEDPHAVHATHGAH